jgi:GTP-binding protein
LVLVREGLEKPIPLKVNSIQYYHGVSTKDTDHASAGDIVILSGIDDVNIGDTICNKLYPKALPTVKVDKPTISMRFYINNSPFSGKEGKHV